MQTAELWTFIDSTNLEIKSEYWNKIYPRFYNLTVEGKLNGLGYLMEFKRYFSAIDACSHFEKEIPSKLIAEILEKAATDKASENTQFDQYRIDRLFEILDERNDIDQQLLIRLEWLYLPILASYGNRRSPKLLHEELSKNPNFFIDVLKWVYKPNDDALIEEERKNLSDEQILNRASQAYELLHSWKKIPGIDDSGMINMQSLLDWIDRVRELAKLCSRLEVADLNIGKILAQFPEGNEIWPPDEICRILEDINTKNIKSGFVIATFNKRGTSSKGAFEGGERERTISQYFKNLSMKHKNKFPNTSILLENLSKDYLAEAKQEDERAERDRLEY